MKGKRIILMMLVVLVAIGGLSCAVLWLQKSKGAKAHAVGNFDLSKYQWEIKTFPSDKNVGQVEDKNTATEKAKSLWLENTALTMNSCAVLLAEEKLRLPMIPKRNVGIFMARCRRIHLAVFRMSSFEKAGKYLLFGWMTDGILPTVEPAVCIFK